MNPHTLDTILSVALPSALSFFTFLAGHWIARKYPPRQIAGKVVGRIRKK